MKNFLIRGFLLLTFILIGIGTILSTIGYETNKFNKLISEKIHQNNEDVLINLKKIKFKIDIKNVSLFLETNNPNLNYRNIDIPINNTKVYLDFFSLLKLKPKINKIHFRSESINIDQLRKIILKVKPSNFSSLILNNIKKGNLTSNIELFLNNDLEIDNFIAKGEVKKMHAIIKDNLELKNTSFNFFADNSDILIKNIQSSIDGFLLSNGALQIEKKENILLKSNFTTQIRIDKKNINKYASYLRDQNLINDSINLKANLNHSLNITFDKTFKIVNYDYKNKGKISQLAFKLKNPIKNSFIENKIKKVALKETDFAYRNNQKDKSYINLDGKYKINNFNYQMFNLKNSFSKNVSNIEADFNYAQNIELDLINYRKDSKKVANIILNLSLKKNKIDFKKITYLENKNLITIEDLNINKNNLISFKKIQVKTFSENVLNNDFIIQFGSKIKIDGKKYDAKKLNKILNQKTKNNILKKISKDIDIDLNNVETPLKKKLKNFKLIGKIKDGKFIKISSKGDFGNNKFLDISLKSDNNNKKKYLEIYSDLPQPLLSEYNFFDGLSGGNLLFSSILEEDISNSKLIINNFKIINAPAVVKLLSLADFGGLADLAEGDGLSFEKLEINFNNKNKFIKLEELYAVGPSISVLMDGYTDSNGLTSLRGTLVPAKNLNKILAKIPVIGKIIIPKEVGEGLFGVSFKMKGPSGKIKTTINPIKTLTPRFITKALEKKTK